MTQFREMRRKTQQLSQADSVAVLERATSGTLAVLGDDGYPYAVPLSYVYADGKLFFHSALAGQRLTLSGGATRRRFASSTPTRCIPASLPPTSAA